MRTRLHTLLARRAIEGAFDIDEFSIVCTADHHTLPVTIHLLTAQQIHCNGETRSTDYLYSNARTYRALSGIVKTVLSKNALCVHIV